MYCRYDYKHDIIIMVQNNSLLTTGIEYYCFDDTIKKQNNYKCYGWFDIIQYKTPIIRSHIIPTLDKYAELVNKLKEPRYMIIKKCDIDICTLEDESKYVRSFKYTFVSYTLPEIRAYFPYLRDLISDFKPIKFSVCSDNNNYVSNLSVIQSKNDKLKYMYFYGVKDGICLPYNNKNFDVLDFTDIVSLNYLIYMNK